MRNARTGEPRAASDRLGGRRRPLFASLALMAAAPCLAADLCDLVAGCNARRAGLSHVGAGGVSIRGRIDQTDQNELGAMLTSYSGGRAGVGSLRDFLLAIMPAREYFDYSIWITPDLLAVHRSRDMAVDTLGAWLEEKRSSEQVMAPPARTEDLYVESDSELLIQDRCVVSRLRQHGRDGILALFDVSLADWSPLLDDSLHPADQTRCFEIDLTESMKGVLTYAWPDSGSGYRTTYSFSVSAGYTPLSVRSEKGGVDRLLVDYLFDPIEAPSVPIAVFKRTLQPDQVSWMVEAYLFDTITLADQVVPPVPRLPALRMEVVAVEETPDLLVFGVMPAVLESAEAEDRLALAMGLVIQNWGSAEPEFDLDGDGTVGPGDLQRAQEEL